MVQQIASVKAESAASALPFTLSVSALSVQNGTRQTFNNELLRQSQPSNANDAGRQSDVARNSITQRETASERQIASVQKQNAINEQAKARADEAHARRQDQVAQTASSPRAVSDNKTVDNTATNNTDGVNRSKVTLNFEADNKPTSNEAFDPNKTSGERTSDVPLVPTSDNTLPEVVTSANGNGGINEQNNIQISREGVTEQFDYIDYVTQLAEFTGSNTDDASQSVALSDNELGILSTDANKMPDIALINTLEIAPESNTALTN
jgi:hypothetical protein